MKIQCIHLLEGYLPYNIIIGRIDNYEVKNIVLYILKICVVSICTYVVLKLKIVLIKLKNRK